MNFYIEINWCIKNICILIKILRYAESDWWFCLKYLGVRLAGTNDVIVMSSIER